MFRLIRNIVVIIAAFVGGLLFERSQAAERCAQLGGTVHENICHGASR